MRHIKYRTSLIATVFFLLAAGVTGTPTASAVELGDFEYDSCTIEDVSGDCTFECKPGLQVFVVLDGSGSIEATCGSSPVAECSGGGCEGSGRYTGTSSRGNCDVEGEGTGTCWSGQRLPKFKL